MNIADGIDFAFVDADNIWEGLKAFLRSYEFADGGEDNFKFEYLIGSGRGKDGVFLWPPHSRRFVYFAEAQGSVPLWLQNAEKTAGIILRTGRLTHKKGVPKQQGVDVLLAVEAMQNSHRKSMTHCTIYSGDGDFLPLVDELVANGTFVRIRHFSNPEIGEVSANFRRGADRFERIGGWDTYCALKQENLTAGMWQIERNQIPVKANKIENGNKFAMTFEQDDKFVVVFDNIGETLLWRIDFNSSFGRNYYVKLKLFEDTIQNQSTWQTIARNQ